MVGAVSDRGRVARLAGALATAAVCAGAIAGGALAASLRISVTPRTIHKGDDYTVKVTGSYKQSELTGRAYLISVLQFTAKPCKATAQLENPAVSNLPVQFYFAPKSAPQKVGIFLTKSPFTRIDSFSAGKTGPRRVCAYLYPKFISASDTTAPIATASAKYRVLRNR